LKRLIYSRFCRACAAKSVHFEKGQTVFSSGESIERFGIVLSGQVQVVQDDYYGNRSILGKIDIGNLFGESFACAEIKTLPVSVITTTESELLFIDCHRLAVPCAKACGFHSRLIQNMLSIVSMKNISLTQKIEFTSKRTTREKLLAYLSAEAKKSGSSSFCIPIQSGRNSRTSFPWSAAPCRPSCQSSGKTAF
jgi:CRP-like cAMP-binding protein